MGLSESQYGAAEIRLPPTLSQATMDTLCHDFAEALDRPERVIVLMGTQDIFCHGLDPTTADFGIEREMTAFVDFLIALATAPKPTLALVDGGAIGGGLGILSACDVVLATGQSRFGLPEALLGLLPAAIFPLLLDRLSLQKVKLLVIDGASRDAAWAFRHGLVDEIIAETSLMLEARRWVRRLGRTAGGGSIPALRQLCRRNRVPGWEEMIRRGAADTLAALFDPGRATGLHGSIAEDFSPWVAR